MEKTIDLSIDAIFKEKFEKDVKGYNPDQVDAFLDRIIRDYDTFESIIDSKNAEIATLKERVRFEEERNANSKADYERLRALERDNSVMQKKLEAIKPGETPTAENLRFLQRIGELESFLYSEGYDPKTLRKRSS